MKTLNIRALNQLFEWVNPVHFWNDKLDTLPINSTYYSPLLLLFQNQITFQ